MPVRTRVNIRYLLIAYFQLFNPGMHYGVVNLFLMIFKYRPAYRDHLQLNPFQGSCKWLMYLFSALLGHLPLLLLEYDTKICTILKLQNFFSKFQSFFSVEWIPRNHTIYI